MRPALVLILGLLGCGGAAAAPPSSPQRAAAAPFAGWPTEIDGVDDAQGLFAGQQPCVVRASGELECVIAEATEWRHLQSELEFTTIALPRGARATIGAEAPPRPADFISGAEPRPTTLLPWTHSPTPLEAPVLAMPFSSARVGVAEGCAVVHEGRAVACWNRAHRIDAPSITTIADGESAVEVSFTVERNRLSSCYAWADSQPHTCARMESGRVACWGWNLVGQLGDGTRVDRATPVFVEGISDATALATGTHHNCVIHADRTVSCWGYGAHGQLGDGADQTRVIPVHVEALHDIVALSLGGYHSCALDSRGHAFCWGPMPAFGMRERRDLEPVFLGAPERLVEIAAGDAYTCARSETGHVFCGGWY